MAESMKANGKIIRCTAKESTLGLMEKFTRVHMRTIASTATEKSHGAMDKSSIEDFGRKVNRTAKVFTRKMEKKRRESGRMENAKAGSSQQLSERFHLIVQCFRTIDPGFDCLITRA